MTISAYFYSSVGRQLFDIRKGKEYFKIRLIFCNCTAAMIESLSKPWHPRHGEFTIKAKSTLRAVGKSARVQEPTQCGCISYTEVEKHEGGTFKMSAYIRLQTCQKPIYQTQSPVFLHTRIIKHIII